MQSLAAGELDEAIPGGELRDEIGRMARAVEVFRENALAVRRMEQEAAAQHGVAEADRQRMMSELASRFEQGMQGVIPASAAAPRKWAAAPRSWHGLPSAAGGLPKRSRPAPSRHR